MTVPAVMRGVGLRPMPLDRFVIAEVILEEDSDHVWRVASNDGLPRADLSAQTDWASWVVFANAVGRHGWELMERRYVANSAAEENGAVVLLFKRLAADALPG